MAKDMYQKRKEIQTINNKNRIINDIENKVKKEIKNGSIKELDKLNSIYLHVQNKNRNIIIIYFLFLVAIILLCLAFKNVIVVLFNNYRIKDAIVTQIHSDYGNPLNENELASFNIYYQFEVDNEVIKSRDYTLSIINKKIYEHNKQAKVMYKMEDPSNNNLFEIYYIYILLSTLIIIISIYLLRIYNKEQKNM